jgi:hypothetical protein
MIINFLRIIVKFVIYITCGITIFRIIIDLSASNGLKPPFKLSDLQSGVSNLFKGNK